MIIPHYCSQYIYICIGQLTRVSWYAATAGVTYTVLSALSCKGNVFNCGFKRRIKLFVLVLDTWAGMKLPRCNHSADMRAPDGLASQGGQMDCRRHDQRTAAVRFEDEPAQLCNGRPEFKICDFVWMYDLGFAGAVTAGACVLCAAGTYQTESGPPGQHCLATHCILINQVPFIL